MEPSPATSRQHAATPARSEHNFYAWCMLILFAAIFVELMGTVAFVHVVLPPRADHASSHLLFNIASGLFATVTLFSICVTEHRRKDDRAQRELVRRLERESVSGCRIIDQDTNTFTREYFDQVLLREIGRTSVTAKSFCVLRCALGLSGTDPKRQFVTCYLETILAQLLRSSVRASDAIAHTGGGEFTIILPGVNEKLAQIPLDRIRRAAERWNRSSCAQYRMRLKIGLCEYDRNSDPNGLLLRLSQRCHLDQHASADLRHAHRQVDFHPQMQAEERSHVC